MLLDVAEWEKYGKYQKQPDLPRQLEKVLLDTGDKHLVAATASG